MAYFEKDYLTQSLKNQHFYAKVGLCGGCGGFDGNNFKKWQTFLDNGTKWGIMEKNGNNGIEMSAIPKEKRYVGEFAKALDEKRRITVPSKWRWEGDIEDDAYISLPNVNGGISVYPPKAFEEVMERVEAAGAGMAFPERQRTIARLSRLGSSFGCDKQGRIMLPEKLLQHAGIKKDAMIIGMWNHFIIWNPDKFDEYVARKEGEDDSTDLSVLMEIGI